MENNPSSYFVGNDGLYVVNIKNTCFLMNSNGGYILWPPTKKHGKLMPVSEWERLRVCSQDTAKPLPEELLKKALQIKTGIEQNRYYGMNAAEIDVARKNHNDFKEAKKLGITIEEYRKRKEKKEEKKGKKKDPPPRTFEPTKNYDGRTHFLMSGTEGFKKLLQST